MLDVLEHSEDKINCQHEHWKGAEALLVLHFQNFPCYRRTGENGLKRTERELETSKNENSTSRNWRFFCQMCTFQPRRRRIRDLFFKTPATTHSWSVCAPCFIQSLSVGQVTAPDQSHAVQRESFSPGLGVRVQGINNSVLWWLVLKSKALLSFCFVFFSLFGLNYRFWRESITEDSRSGVGLPVVKVCWSWGVFKIAFEIESAF